MLTPLDDKLQIDHAHFAEHARNLLASGCGGVTLFGTTGEGPSFSLVERREALEQMVSRGVPAANIIVSTSCAALNETLELSRHAVDLGVHACLMLPPFFLKGVSDQGIIDCYRQVIEGVGADRLRLYLYHIPQVSGVALSHAVIATLKAAYPQTILGIKDSACNTAHSVGLADAFMKDMTVYVGYEPDLPEMGRRGSTGAISGLANFMPRVVHRLVSAPDAATTVADRDRVLALIRALDDFSLMPALKGIMAATSGDNRWLRVRAPLVALTAAQALAVDQLVQTFSLNPSVD
jgi:4-hydroxy-tetrahydrodipicolinate synthase